MQPTWNCTGGSHWLKAFWQRGHSSVYWCFLTLQSSFCNESNGVAWLHYFPAFHKTDMRDGRRCPIRYPGVASWSEMTGRPKLEDSGLDISFKISPLYCDILLFPKSSDKSEIRRIFIAILRHRRPVISYKHCLQHRAGLALQKKLCMKQKLFWEMFVSLPCLRSLRKWALDCLELHITWCFDQT